MSSTNDLDNCPRAFSRIWQYLSTSQNEVCSIAIFIVQAGLYPHFGYSLQLRNFSTVFGVLVVDDLYVTLTTHDNRTLGMDFVGD